MNRDDQSALLLLLLAAYLVSKGAARVRAKTWDEKLRDFGATVHKATHPNTEPGDLNHPDLPGSQLTREALLAIAKNAGFPDPKLAAAIALAESGGVTNAIARSSREISVGLWQINTLVQPYSERDMRNPLKNARAAFLISKGGTNWKPWASFVNGRYKQFQTGILK